MHTQPNELPQLSPQDVTQHAAILEANKSWYAHPPPHEQRADVGCARQMLTRRVGWMQGHREGDPDHVLVHAGFVLADRLQALHHRLRVGPQEQGPEHQPARVRPVFLGCDCAFGVGDLTTRCVAGTRRRTTRRCRCCSRTASSGSTWFRTRYAPCSDLRCGRMRGADSKRDAATGVVELQLHGRQAPAVDGLWPQARQPQGVLPRGQSCTAPVLCVASRCGHVVGIWLAVDTLDEAALSDWVVLLQSHRPVHFLQFASIEDVTDGHDRDDALA